MHFGEKFWASVTYVVNIFTLSPFEGPVSDVQSPLSGSPGPLMHENLAAGPVFKPPGGDPRGPDADFKCDYSNMPGFVTCSTAENRACWLKNSTFEYNINTNYENLAPEGVHRYYDIDLTDASLNADGLDFKDAKVFNEQYPGPWIQACWGDVGQLSRPWIMSCPTIEADEDHRLSR